MSLFRITIDGWDDLIAQLKRLNDTLSQFAAEPDFTSEDASVKAETQSVKEARDRLPPRT